MFTFIKRLFAKKENIKTILEYPEVLKDIQEIMNSEKFSNVIKDNITYPQLLYEDNCELSMISYLMDNYYDGKYNNIFKSKVNAENIFKTISEYKVFTDFIKKQFISNIENNISEMNKECKEIEDQNKLLGDDTGVDEIHHPAQKSNPHSDYDSTEDISIYDERIKDTIEDA